MNPFRCELFQTVLDIVFCIRIRASIRYLLILGLLYSTGAMADTVSVAQCERDGISRLVELTEQPPTGLPCQVLYHKPQEDQSSSRLWHAISDFNYCRTQFEVFLIKLETKYSWDCKLDGLTPNGQELEDEIGDAVADEARAVIKTPVAKETAVANKTTTANETITEEIVIAAKELPPVNAISDSKLDKSVSNSQNTATENRQTDGIQPGEKYGFHIEEVMAEIPSGIYFYDSVGSSAPTREVCPADGYFIWNTQDRSRPVFEMGLVSEFPGPSEVPVVQRDGNGSLRLSTESMILQPLRQTTTATVGASGNDGIELEILGTLTDSEQTTICRYLRG